MKNSLKPQRNKADEVCDNKKARSGVALAAPNIRGGEGRLTHASLCKKTYKMAPRFHPTKLQRMDSHRMERMRSHAIAVFLFLASAAMFPAQGALDITTTSLPQATQGVPYSVQLTASGNMGNVTWSIAMNPGEATGTLPPNLSLSSTGLISGTPTTVAGYSFTVDAIDQESNFASRALSIDVAPCGPSVTPASLPPGRCEHRLHASDVRGGRLSRYWALHFFGSAQSTGTWHDAR